MSRVLEGLCPELFDLHIEQTGKRRRVEEKAGKKIHAVEHTEKVVVSAKALTMRQYAYFLRQNYANVDVGRQRLYNWFRKEGVIKKGSRVPHKIYVELGYFEVRYVNTASPKGIEEVAMILPEGQKNFTKAILRDFTKRRA